jgi:hypothetical protein
MKISVELAMLVRMVRHVTVEVPDDFFAKCEEKCTDDYEPLMELEHELYQMDDGENFMPDDTWGCEEGTHGIITKEALCPATFRLNDEGEVVPVTETKE